MTKFQLSSTLLCLLLASEALASRSLVQIEIGKALDPLDKVNTPHFHSNKRLRQRVGTLEAAIIKLQNEVLRLKESRPSPQHSCMIQTPFDGTFLGSGRNIVEAKASALKACEKGEGGINCSKKKLECS